MATKKNVKKNQSAEQLRKDAIRSADANIARLDKAAKGATRGGGKGASATKATSSGKRDTAKRRGDGAKRRGCLVAAVEVLTSSSRPMSCKEIVAAAIERKLWSSSGATPEATLYSAIIREISSKGKSSRFRKVARGRFELATAGAA